MQRMSTELSGRRQVNLDGLFHVETTQVIQVQEQNCNTNSEYHLHSLHSHPHTTTIMVSRQKHHGPNALCDAQPTRSNAENNLQQVVKVIWHKGCITAAHGWFNRIRQVAPMCIPSNTCFLGPTQVQNLNGISIGSALFVGLASVTDRQTDRPRYSVCNNMPHLRT